MFERLFVLFDRPESRIVLAVFGAIIITSTETKSGWYGDLTANAPNIFSCGVNKHKCMSVENNAISGEHSGLSSKRFSAVRSFGDNL